MKKKFLVLAICGILLILSGVVFVITSNSSKENNNSNNIEKNNTNNTNNNSNVSYSTCAKSGYQCNASDIYKGQLVKVAVNSKDSYDFYVLSDDGQNVTLLMNDFVGKPTPWLSNEDRETIFSKDNSYVSYGPYTALKAINDATSGWDYISNISNYEYNVIDDRNEGYFKEIKINDGVITGITNSGSTYTVPGTAKARLVTYEELKNLNSEGQSYPDWLFEKITKIKEQYSGNYGYYYFWTMTPSGSYYGDGNSYAVMGFSEITKINSESSLLLFPVITIEKSKIK